MTVPGSYRSKKTRHNATLMRRFATCFMALAATVGSIALAPEAAGGHETLGGGTFQVSNSDSPCTDFEAGGQSYTSCPGGAIYVPPGNKYIVVPLRNHFWASCDTYAPNGQLYEHEVEKLADLPRHQLFWAQQGWGPYTPEAMCQLW